MLLLLLLVVATIIALVVHLQSTHTHTHAVSITPSSRLATDVVDQKWAKALEGLSSSSSSAGCKTTTMAAL